MPVAVATPSLMDNAEFLAALEGLETRGDDPTLRGSEPGDAFIGPRVEAGRRHVDWEPRPQFNDSDPKPIVSMTTRAPAFVATLVWLVGLGMGAGGAAVIFQARLAVLLR